MPPTQHILVHLDWRGAWVGNMTINNTQFTMTPDQTRYIVARMEITTHAVFGFHIAYVKTEKGTLTVYLSAPAYEQVK